MSSDLGFTTNFSFFFYSSATLCACWNLGPFMAACARAFSIWEVGLLQNF